MLTDCGEPSCYKEALQVVDSEKWHLAMQSEMAALHKNQTWDLVKLPDGKKALPCKWVYIGISLLLMMVSLNTKHDWLLKDLSKSRELILMKSFCRFVKMTTLRCVLALVATHDLILHQMDVKTTFLHRDLHEEVYMQQPEGYVEKGKEQLVCQLRKSLYGLKQAPREWYQKFHQFMLSQGYKQSEIDHCLYTKQAKDGSLLILILYVDDMLIAGRHMAEISALK